MKYKALQFLLFLCLTLGSVQQAAAQCAMCRATVENNISSGGSSVGAGLNSGILYLMSIPYILIAVVAFMWYRSSRKNMLYREKINQALGRV
ncbi:hypothetical protein [Algivirga pacifica]|uniref:Uncharacterized protein n=1 Tax=Algivirga pacifica TaxID=1162670 RepID=A0ABP9DCJ8_9BACT